MVKLRPVAVITLISISAFTVLYFTALLIGGLIRLNINTDTEYQQAEIYLDNNGRHFDIWLPAEYCGFIEDSESDAAGWYGFGWGDRDFFLNTPYAADINPGVLLKALFLPSRSVLAVQHSVSAPGQRLSVTSMKAGTDEIKKASSYIESWFIRNPEGLERVPSELVHPSYVGYQFFESRGLYSIFFTSNNWVNQVLKKAGLRTGLWTPLTFGVAG
jgi:uncharacterized protein (TIGR02117 family)